MHISNIHTPSQPTSPPPNFCCVRVILWCSASGIRAFERFSNIWAQTWPSWLSLERGVPRALMGCLCRALGFQADCAVQTESLLCPAPSCVCWVLKNRQAGPRGRQPHERGARLPPPSETDSGTGLMLSWDADRHRSKRFGGKQRC